MTKGTILVIAEAVVLWQFFWAGRTFKLPEGERPAFRHQLFPLALMLSLVLSFSQPLRVGLAVPGCVGLAGALALFEWARRSIRGRYFSFVYSLDTPEFLWTAGPFAYVRNPIYTSYLLTAASVALMLFGISSMFGFTILAVVAHRAARHEESKFLASDLREEYRDYATRTGRFIPGVGRLGRNQEP